MRAVVTCGAAAVLLGVVAAVSAQENISFQEWLARDQAEFQKYSEEVTAAYQKFQEEEIRAYHEFLRQAGVKWGSNNVWVPEKTIWVQYREDFAERSNVKFEDGECHIQLVYDKGVDTDSPAVRKELADAVQYLVLSGTEDPIRMTGRMMKEGTVAAKADTTAAVARAAGAATYEVQPGDTLWGVAKKLQVDRTELARANGIDANGWLTKGQVLRVPGAGDVTRAATPAEGTGGGSPRGMPDSKNPLLLGQVKMPNGVVVTRDNADEFGTAVVASSKPQVEMVKGSDGNQRQAVMVGFNLVPEHLTIRARRYEPYVTSYAKKNELIPAMVYGLMQTESAFNPRARSAAPAYGLMQLVPRSGARDAYLSAHGEDKLLDPDYLYDPEKNVELGTELLKVLDKRYLKAVKDPFSRMYCAIAAYNTGAGNVARAFIDGTSMQRAAVEINAMTPDQVYAKLCRDLPYEETRNYVKRVRDRMTQYAGW